MNAAAIGGLIRSIRKKRRIDAFKRGSGGGDCRFGRRRRGNGPGFAALGALGLHGGGTDFDHGLRRDFAAAAGPLGHQVPANAGRLQNTPADQTNGDRPERNRGPEKFCGFCVLAFPLFRMQLRPRPGGQGDLRSWELQRTTSRSVTIRSMGTSCSSLGIDSSSNCS